jgi:hypothetical protein
MRRLHFSIIDVTAILTDQHNYQTARKYWNKLKERLKKEGNETVTNCHQLKMKATDGKMRMTDVADTEQLLRLIQTVPSPKAEPLKTIRKIGQLNSGIASKKHRHKHVSYTIVYSFNNTYICIIHYNVSCNK